LRAKLSRAQPSAGDGQAHAPRGAPRIAIRGEKLVGARQDRELSSSLRIPPPDEHRQVRLGLSRVPHQVVAVDLQLIGVQHAGVPGAARQPRLKPRVGGCLVNDVAKARQLSRQRAGVADDQDPMTFQALHPRAVPPSRLLASPPI
jgi:hypothetical protein